MIREKAKELLNLLKQGSGSATIFGSSYYDDETLQIIEVATNECKSTVVREDKTSKKYESDTYIYDIKEIIQQLLTDKNTIKNSLVSKLTRIPGRDIAGITVPVRVDKKINELGIPYIEIDNVLPDNLSQIISDEKGKEEFIKTIMKPYVARLSKKEPQLSRRHFLSKVFSPFNRKEISDEELVTKIEYYLKRNTDLDEEKIHNTSNYLTYNILGNESIIEDVINDEIQGKSIEVVGAKRKVGYNGMLQNMSNNLLDILNAIPNPNEGLKEVEDIYANLVGQLEALSVEPNIEPTKMEEQIKNINRNINRHRQEYYSEDGYRTVNVGFNGLDAGLLRKEHVSQAMQIYSEEITKLLEQSKKMTEEQYIKEVAKLHFRFVQIHPFPDGNGRTARAISNMLLLEKNMTAVFTKQNKDEYIKQMGGLRAGVVNKEYIKGLYTDQSICNELEEEKAYKLEEYIGMKCLDKSELYSARNITEALPQMIKEESR